MAVNTCMVQLRLPNGALKQRSFQATDNIAAVCAWAHIVLREQSVYESCKLVLPPRQVLGEEQSEQTLRELGLLPRVSFNVQLRSADGRVTAAPRAGAEFEIAFAAELTGMLEVEGFSAWEACQWATLVEGQLQNGEMRRVRTNVRALFGGLRLPSTIGAWAARVDLAPTMPEPAKAPDPSVRFRHELSCCTAAEKEALGFVMLPLPSVGKETGQPPVPAPRICTLRVFNFAPASGLARDLSILGSEASLPQEIVLQIHFGPDFPFEAPAVRVVYPILTGIPLATASVPGGEEGGGEVDITVSVAMALQANAVAASLQGAKCGVWSLNMGQSFPRFAGWLRNWMIGCGTRVNTSLSKSLGLEGGGACVEGDKQDRVGRGCDWFLPTVGGLWLVLKVVITQDGGRNVSLPAGLRVMVEDTMDVEMGCAGGQDGQAEDVRMTGVDASVQGADWEEEGAEGEGLDDDEEEEEKEKDAEVDETPLIFLIAIPICDSYL